jgi:hypothetical protein
MDGVLPDQDRALTQLTGWGSYSQPFYSGGKAAASLKPGARAVASALPLPPGDHRVWLRVFAYGPVPARVDLSSGGRATSVSWRAGALGLGWVAADLPGSPGGPLEIVTRESGQSFAIVDQIVVER